MKTDLLELDLVFIKEINVLDEDQLSMLITSRLNFFKALSILQQIIRICKLPSRSVVQQINRYLLLLGPILLLLLYMLSNKTLATIIANIILPLLEQLKILNSMVKRIFRILINLIIKVSGNVFGLLLLIVLLPICSFFMIIGSFLSGDDPEVKKHFSSYKVREYLNDIYHIFVGITKSLISFVPFGDRFFNFLQKLFDKIRVLFRSGKPKVKSVIEKYKEKEQEKTEAGGIIGFFITGFITFIMSILKKIKLLGVIGIFFVIIVKFVPSIKSMLFRIPGISQIVNFILAAGLSLGRKMKLNKFVKYLIMKKREFIELQKTLDIMKEVSE